MKERANGYPFKSARGPDPVGPCSCPNCRSSGPGPLPDGADTAGSDRRVVGPAEYVLAEILSAGLSELGHGDSYYAAGPFAEWVLIHFPKARRLFALSPEGARELAADLIKLADVVEVENAEG